MKLISVGWALPLNHQGPLQNGAMVVDGDQIVAGGPADQLKQKYPDIETENFPDSVLMPGLVNAHCHLDLAGFYERFTVATETQISPIGWLLESLQYLSKTPSATVAKKMKESIDNLLATGTTCVGTMTHYEGTFPLIKNTPIRGVVFQEILSGPDKRAQQRFEVALALIDQYLDAKPDHLKIGFGPYSAYLLSKNLL